KHFAKLMTDTNGGIVDFTTFRNKIQDDGHLFNKTWLETEYNTALATAEGIDLYHSFGEEDVLEISTVGDDKVRKSHAALDGFTARRSHRIWKKIWIPFDFNCRCHIIPGQARNIKDDFTTSGLIKE